MAGTIPLSMTQQLDEFGAPLAGGFLYIIQAGTVATPQIAYQDSALTIPVAGGSRITLDASGRLPQFFLADGSIKIRLTDKNGATKLVADGLIVTGASSGGGGGSPVDPTTVLQTGWIQPIYGTGVVDGFVRLNGRTIGSATSGATERANADTAALFAWLYADPNLAVSTGRGASAAADYAANKTIALPDWRGRTIAGLDDMGNTAAGRLTSTYFGTAATVLGAAGGDEKRALTAPQIPVITSVNNGTFGIAVKSARFVVSSPSGTLVSATAGGAVGGLLIADGAAATQLDSTGTVLPSTFGTASNNTSGTTSGAAHPTAFNAMLATIYIKL